MQTSMVQVNGVPFQVAQQGQGQPLLLVHGFPLDHSMWRHQLSALSMHFHVIAPDLRGFGQSHGAGAHVLRMEQFADDLAALLDAVRIPGAVHFCGLSMGGYIAWQFWARHRSRVARLVLCDTRAVADPTDAAQARLALAQRVMEEGSEVVAEAMLPKLFAESTRVEQPELVEGTRQTMARTERTAVAGALRGMAERPDFAPLLTKIDVPALVICGQHDSISPPAEMAAIARAIPAAEYVEIPGAGHMAPLEKPAEVNTAIREFLTREMPTAR